MKFRRPRPDPGRCSTQRRRNVASDPVDVRSGLIQAPGTTDRAGGVARSRRRAGFAYAGQQGDGQRPVIRQHQARAARGHWPLPSQPRCPGPARAAGTRGRAAPARAAGVTSLQRRDQRHHDHVARRPAAAMAGPFRCHPDQPGAQAMQGSSGRRDGINALARYCAWPSRRIGIGGTGRCQPVSSRVRGSPSSPMPRRARARGGMTGEFLPFTGRSSCNPCCDQVFCMTGRDGTSNLK